MDSTKLRYSALAYIGQKDYFERVYNPICGLLQLIQKAIESESLADSNNCFQKSFSEVSDQITELENKIAQQLKDERVYAFARVLWSRVGVQEWKPSVSMTYDQANAAVRAYNALERFELETKTALSDSRNAASEAQNQQMLSSMISQMASTLRSTMVEVKPEMEVDAAFQSMLAADLERDCLAALGDDCDEILIVALAQMLLLSADLFGMVGGVLMSLADYQRTESYMDSDVEKDHFSDWWDKFKSIKHSLIRNCWFLPEENKHLIQKHLDEQSEQSEQSDSSGLSNCYNDHER